MKTIQTTRVILNPEEKLVRKSWDTDWPKMRKADSFLLMFADWSGYNSSQYRITHCSLAPKTVDKSNFPVTVQFTDNTTMTIFLEEYSLEKLLEKNVMKKLAYESLICEALASGQSFYKV